MSRLYELLFACALGMILGSIAFAQYGIEILMKLPHEDDVLFIQRGIDTCAVHLEPKRYSVDRTIKWKSGVDLHGHGAMLLGHLDLGDDVMLEVVE